VGEVKGGRGARAGLQVRDRHLLERRGRLLRRLRARPGQLRGLGDDLRGGAVPDTRGHRGGPRLQAEERGQAEAIARSTEECLGLSVPLVAAIVGEGGSGGAIALAAANRVLMLEHSVYAVISPEGCASILWRTADRAADAAEAMRITATDLKQLGVIERIVPEPLGGAHRDQAAAVQAVGDALSEELQQLSGKTGRELRAERRAKFLAIG